MSGTENNKVFYRLLLLWIEMLREEMDRYNELEKAVMDILANQ